MNISTAKNILSFACKNDDSVLMSSKHGIGKSSIGLQFTQEQKYHFEPLFLSHQEVGDLIGIPEKKLIDGENVTYWTKPEWLKRIEMAAERGVKSVLLLDELNRAEHDVLQVALQLVLDGQIHDHSLPKGALKTFIISAINPSDQYQTAELDPALLDRFLKLDIVVDVPTWLIWANNNNINIIVCNFIEQNPEFLHWTPEEQEADSDFDGCGTSPRSWAKVSGYIDMYIRGELPEEYLFNILKGKIGTHVGHVFYSYVLSKGQICADDIINLIDKLKKYKADDIKYSHGVKEFCEDVDGIQKNLIANHLLNKTINGLDYKYILIYLYSLEMEYVVPILKTIKEDYPDVYSMLALSDKDNDKELFKRIVKLIRE